MKLTLSILLITLSLALLIPGVTQPILTINGTIEKAAIVDQGLEMLATNLSAPPNSNARNMLDMAVSMFGLEQIEGEVEVFRKTRSILDTVNELYQSNNILVAVLVGLFSIVIPILKLTLMLIACLPIANKMKQIINRIISFVGKWSMADVFVVALIIVYMAGNASAGMGELLQTYAHFEAGFYYFLAYCLFSIASHALFHMQQTTPSHQQMQSN
ncbi:paraquat-inducible protein A [Shewanella holmiensis]|uniref:Paraquat-inducible protein A n=1 Tax=Shewanella holmiensis TaxID=2952222 RepID=A0A9X2WN34_9GAMM|nr:paraquat-inducible protein A [Shewanella holmiensis]MCT7941922.1 paraquat-inducible protein A [Shewanella holmiensis]